MKIYKMRSHFYRYIRLNISDVQFSDFSVSAFESETCLDRVRPPDSEDRPYMDNFRLMRNLVHRMERNISDSISISLYKS